MSVRWQSAGMLVGLVPTMGALHDGHRSLVRRAREECDRVVVSVFVNPAQFGPGEDLERYPRTLDEDLALLAAEGADAAFVPGVEDMYPAGAATSVHVAGPLSESLEGAVRPGHFDGVALIVSKLLVSARPNRAYFGHKDAQQCAVVRRLAADLDTGVEVVLCPTVRDGDGLALSSRNRYLSAEDRAEAVAIPAALAAAARAFAAGERRSSALISAAAGVLAGASRMCVDYVATVDPETFATVDTAAVGTKILVAARIGGTRLIDNLSFGIDSMPGARRATPQV